MSKQKLKNKFKAIKWKKNILQTFWAVWKPLFRIFEEEVRHAIRMAAEEKKFY